MTNFVDQNPENDPELTREQKKELKLDMQDFVKHSYPEFCKLCDVLSENSKISSLVNSEFPKFKKVSKVVRTHLQTLLAI